MSDQAKIVCLQDVPATPWHNGGGVTRELLAWPPGEPWSLRISVASIARSGPFSRFAGVQRWFVVIDGAGVRLQGAGGDRELRPGDPPWGFDGGDAPDCTLLDGPTLDLNFMVQHSFGRSAMMPAAQRAGLDADLAERRRFVALYTAAPLLLTIGSTSIELPAASLAWSASPQTQGWSVPVGSSAPAWWLSVES